jgi:hypothetical protein
MFNDRILFLLEGQHIGYLSKVDPKQPLQDLNFEQSKMTVLLPHIRTIQLV